MKLIYFVIGMQKIIYQNQEKKDFVKNLKRLLKN